MFEGNTRTRKPSKEELDTIFHECRQCGSCCTRYKKILLEPSEVEFIKKMGGHVGKRIRLDDLREKKLDELIKEQKGEKVYMIHPDDSGCVFLQKKDGKHTCKIYHHRPKVCSNFNCNFADNTVMNILFKDPIHLLGMDSWGQKIERDH